MSGGRTTLERRKLNAIYYLNTLKNYKIEHGGTYVELYHWGNYGFTMGGGPYKCWRSIEKVYYENDNTLIDMLKEGIKE